MLSLVLRTGIVAYGEWCFNGYVTDYVKGKLPGRFLFTSDHTKERGKRKCRHFSTALPTYALFCLYPSVYSPLLMQ